MVLTDVMVYIINPDVEWAVDELVPQGETPFSLCTDIYVFLDHASRGSGQTNLGPTPDVPTMEAIASRIGAKTPAMVMLLTALGEDGFQAVVSESGVHSLASYQQLLTLAQPLGRVVSYLKSMLQANDGVDAGVSWLEQQMRGAIPGTSSAGLDSHSSLGCGVGIAEMALGSGLVVMGLAEKNPVMIAGGASFLTSGTMMATHFC